MLGADRAGEHPAVRGAACVAVPDEIRGEEVKAFIQLLPGETPETAPPEAILTFCRDRLAGFKVPRYLSYVADFPMTPSQRIEKHRLVQPGADLRAGAYDGATGRWL